MDFERKKASARDCRGGDRDARGRLLKRLLVIRERLQEFLRIYASVNTRLAYATDLGIPLDWVPGYTTRFRITGPGSRTSSFFSSVLRSRSGDSRKSVPLRYSRSKR